MNEQQNFSTARHSCSFHDLGVMLYNIENLEEGEAPDVFLELSHKEALEIAHHILAHEAELKAHQTELDASFTRLSEDLVALFAELDQKEREAWTQEIAFIPGVPYNFNQQLNVAYQRLKKQSAAQVQHWTHEDERREVSFWLTFERFFYEQYRDDLIEKFLPEENEEIE